MKTALIVQHLAIESIGTFGPLLERLGYTLQICLAGRDDIRHIDPYAPDLAVVMGGPIGAYDTADYPFLNFEIDWLRARLTADLPTLGICLGAQLMAAALDAKVFPGPVPEVGWGGIVLTDGAQHHPIVELVTGSNTVLHWHNDTFHLPVGARLLASTPLYQNQAFAIGKRGLALQFHVEVEPVCIEQWLIGFTGELRRLGLEKIVELRAASVRESQGLAVRAETFFRRWLDLTALQERAA